jgi:hypothetical protein
MPGGWFRPAFDLPPSSLCLCYTPTSLMIESTLIRFKHFFI